MPISQTIQQPQTQSTQPTSITDSPSFPLLVVLLLCMAGASYFSHQNRKGKIGRAKFASTWTIKKAFRSAQQQIWKGAHNEVGSLLNQKIGLSDLQRGVAVVGGPGSGKTFSAIDPIARSLIEQGKSVILYDFKFPDQSSKIAAFAAKNGYEISCFAPGQGGDRCNILDLIKVGDQECELFQLNDSVNTVMARQIAQVLIKNFKRGESQDPTWDNAAAQLTEAVFLLTATTPHPDLITAASILSLEDLPKRLENNADKIDPWILARFDQFMAAKSSSKTLASILFTAQALFGKFLDPVLAQDIATETTIPLDLSSKQLLILGLDKKTRDATAPLLAAILTSLVDRNVAQRRETTLALLLDELPTLRLDRLSAWINEERSNGLVSVIGFQNLNQLNKTYGKELSTAIFGGCNTKILFNPGEPESAQQFSKFLGQTEIHTRQRSRNYGGGKVSRNIAEQHKLRDLVSPDEFLRFPPGRGVILNAGYKNKTEGLIPYLTRVFIDKKTIEQVSHAQRLWDSAIAPKILGTPKRADADTLAERKQWLEEILPVKQKKKLSLGDLGGL